MAASESLGLGSILNQDVIDFFSDAQQEMAGHYTDYVGYAISLCAIFMIITFSLKAYELMLGQGQANIMPLFRPFALLMVILYWQPFTTIIAYPSKLIAQQAKTTLYENLDDVDQLLNNRQVLIDTALIRMATVTGDIQTSKDQTAAADLNFFQQIGAAISNAFDSLSKAFAATFMLVSNNISFLIAKFVEFFLAIVFQASVYLIMFLQLIFQTILIMLGPFAFAISILPAFRDNYVTWISRYISVTLYTPVAYIVLNVVMSFVTFTINAETDKLTYLLQAGNEYQFLAWAEFSPGAMGYVWGALLVGIFSMFTVPIISTWIISTSGVGSAVASFSKAATSAAKSATKLVGA